ncbi:hypothetical protein GQ457_03G007850 [Hibiscus cannabinus]
MATVTPKKKKENWGISHNGNRTHNPMVVGVLPEPIELAILFVKSIEKESSREIPQRLKPLSCPDLPHRQAVACTAGLHVLPDVRSARSCPPLSNPASPSALTAVGNPAEKPPSTPLLCADSGLV